jgi:hypothetical protein
MAETVRIRYRVPSTISDTVLNVKSGLTVGELIALICRATGDDVDRVSVNDATASPNDRVDDFLQSTRNALFDFSKADPNPDASAPSSPGPSDPPSPDPPNPEPPNQEQPKPEPPIPAQPKPGSPNQEQPKPDPPNQEQSKPDPPIPEQPKPDPSNVEPRIPRPSGPTEAALPKSHHRRGVEFPPSLRQVTVKTCYSETEIDVPDGIIAHLTRECGGNVRDHDVVGVTSSRPIGSLWAAKNVANLEDSSCFHSAHRDKNDIIPPAKNNWICYDFKDRKVIPTHYAVRSSTGVAHPSSWVVEVSKKGKKWKEIDHKENNIDLNRQRVTRVFPAAASKPCRFVRLANVGRNHRGTDSLLIEAWEIFGKLIE